MVSGILIAMAVVGAVGLFIGLFLGIAGIKFKVEVDEREEAVLSALPGNNCGGCGYAGCANRKDHGRRSGKRDEKGCICSLSGNLR